MIRVAASLALTALAALASATPPTGPAVYEAGVLQGAIRSKISFSGFTSEQLRRLGDNGINLDRLEFQLDYETRVNGEEALIKMVSPGGGVEVYHLADGYDVRSLWVREPDTGNHFFLSHGANSTRIGGLLYPFSASVMAHQLDHSLTKNRWGTIDWLPLHQEVERRGDNRTVSLRLGDTASAARLDYESNRLQSIREFDASLGHQHSHHQVTIAWEQHQEQWRPRSFSAVMLGPAPDRKPTLEVAATVRAYDPNAQFPEFATLLGSGSRQLREIPARSTDPAIQTRMERMRGSFNPTQEELRRLMPLPPSPAPLILPSTGAYAPRLIYSGIAVLVVTGLWFLFLQRRMG